jgi:hypothetical protein
MVLLSITFHEHVHQLKLLSLASFLYLIAVLIPMVMGRFLIDIYPISPFTSIREEQGLNMEAVYPVYHSRKAWVLDKLIL